MYVGSIETQTGEIGRVYDGDRYFGCESDFRKICESAKEGNGREIRWIYNGGVNERLEVRFGLENVAEVEGLISALQRDMCDHETEGARTELATGERQAV